MNNIKFDYERETVLAPLTVPTLLDWIRELHAELTNLGLLPSKISDETHKQITILSQYDE